MVRYCDYCIARAHYRCKRHRKSFCKEHGMRCPGCGAELCMDCLVKRECPNCHTQLLICPTCLSNRKISRLKADSGKCPVCGK
ncbi:MAG: hypothetical protein QW279_12690 [Candidatus Jordarchaeaceae archaeon]